jgi:hypothetical protein
MIGIVTFMFLSGCYYPSWYRPETTHEQLRGDSDTCKNKLIIGSSREENISAYEKCMTEKGYRKKESPERR